MSWQPYIKPPAECGTDSGYHRHRHQATQPCPECRQAHAAAEHRRRRRNIEAHRATYRDWYHRTKAAA